MNKIILLVEDNKDNSLLFCYILKRAGYTVNPVNDALEATEFLKTTIPDIILSDISLPGMNGNEFLKIIRADEKLKDVCAIAVSAFAREEDKKRTLLHGYDAFIEKPIVAESFAQQIGEIYEKKQQQPN